MMRSSPPRSVAIAKAEDHAWRGRTMMAFALLALAVIGVGAGTMDWSQDLALSLGEAAGLIAPLALIGAMAWAIAAWVGERR